MTDPLNTLQGLCRKERYKVAVALSGGIDSTASAILLRNQGYKVIALYMQIHDKSLGLPPESKACFGPLEEERIEYARSICKRLGIPIYVIDLRKEFREDVIEYFRNEYLSGRTPNPCVRCNFKIKFSALLKKAIQKGIEFDLFATGHHVKKEKKANRYILKKGYDKKKDQSYFLYRLSQRQLTKTLFPAGEFKKEDLKKMIQELGIEPKKESQDFISGTSYHVLFKRDEIKEGPILDKNGKIIGTHKGIIYYTVGQRKGLGISSSKPFYVIKIDAKKNAIFVGHKEDTFSKEMIVSDINWVSIEKPNSYLRAKVKIRQQHKEAEATLYPASDKIKVVFDIPQMAITPGQSAVFYDEDMVLGGGIIACVGE